MTVEFDHVTAVYRSLVVPERRALKDISTRIDHGEIAAVVGASGSGKTTLIQHMNGLLLPTLGRILVNGIDLTASETNLRAVRRSVGLVFQFPEFQLFEETVFQDVAFGPKNLGIQGPELEKRVRLALEWVGLNCEAFMDRSPFHLSGGEKRRVALSGVLAMQPEILILDEPTVGLDPASASRIEEIIRSYHGSGKTVIFVSHDMDLVARLARRILVLDQGNLIFDGTADRLFQEEDLLKRASLRLPQTVRYMKRLQSGGMDVRCNVVTVEEAKRELLRWQEGMGTRSKPKKTFGKNTEKS